MAYNENFPADDSYLSDFPAGDREQNRALKDDQIVNAGQLQGLTAGNENGQIPINNGTENTNLNAALLNGKASSYFATSNHTHDTATQSSNGYMSNADKKKLDGIASGAEVNQNAFANVKVGSTTIQSDAKQDTLELVAGTNISLVGDANNDKVTIGVTGTVAKASQDSDGNAINTTYLKRSGGTMRGALNLANKTLNLAGDDCYFGDQDIAGGFCLKGANGTTNLTLINKDNATQKASLSYAGGNLISSATIQGNLSGTATNATNATNATRLSNKGTIAATTLPNSLTTGLTTHDAYNNSYPVPYGNVINIYNRGKSQLLCEWKGDDTAAADPGHLYYRECRDNQNVWSNWKTVAFTTDNVSSATKATQDKNGLQIDTNYLKRSGGTITGQLTMGTGTEVQIKAPNNTGFYFNSGALGCYNWSGTNGGSIFDYSPSRNTFIFGKNVTAPTPGTTDNSTRVATTAFVQSLINSLKGSIGGTISAASLNENGYVKFSNGFIVQWGRVHLTDSGWEGEVGPFNFPISFSSSCFFVLPSLGNSDGGNPKSYDSSVQQRRWNNSQFWLYQQDLGGHPWFAFAHYIAFGR